MWRSFFLAIGLFVMFLGAECIVVQEFRLRMHEPPQQQQSSLFAPQQPQVGPQRVLRPQPWVPWSFLSTGAVVCLYSFTIPARIAGK